MIVKPIKREEAFRLILKYHYSKVMPKLTKLCLGGFEDNTMVAIMTLGWGVRPKHTIKRLFPSLDTEDYWEIGKMCIIDEMPDNTGSHFISLCLNWVKSHHPNIKLVFTWADGMLGKPGFVYQSANFLYSGYIWTDTYFTNEGEKVHPRKTKCIGGRPSPKKQKEMGWAHYRGKQFRYVYFLCSNGQKKRLLRESPFRWNNEYPKHTDLEWKKWTEGFWVKTKKPFYNPDRLNFNNLHKKRADWYERHPPLENYNGAEEASRETRPVTNGESLVRSQASASSTYIHAIRGSVYKKDMR